VIGATTLLLLNYLWTRFLFKHQKLDRFVEGSSDLLIENGRINHRRLKKELITVSELQQAAHKQGFASLEEVDRAVLEQGGTLSFIGKTPSAEVERHNEVLKRLDQLSQEIAKLRAN